MSSIPITLTRKLEVTDEALTPLQAERIAESLNGKYVTVKTVDGDKYEGTVTAVNRFALTVRGYVRITDHVWADSVDIAIENVLSIRGTL